MDYGTCSNTEFVEDENLTFQVDYSSSADSELCDDEYLMYDVHYGQISESSEDFHSNENFLVQIDTTKLKLITQSEASNPNTVHDISLSRTNTSIQEYTNTTPAEDEIEWTLLKSDSTSCDIKKFKAESEIASIHCHISSHISSVSCGRKLDSDNLKCREVKCKIRKEAQKRSQWMRRRKKVFCKKQRTNQLKRKRWSRHRTGHTSDKKDKCNASKRREKADTGEVTHPTRRISVLPRKEEREKAVLIGHTIQTRLKHSSVVYGT